MMWSVAHSLSPLPGCFLPVDRANYMYELVLVSFNGHFVENII